MPNETFATDADLLDYEPRVFIDMPVPPRQKLKITDGDLAGTSLTSQTGGFVQLLPDDVLVVRSGSGDAGAHAVASVIDDHAVELATQPAHLDAAHALTVVARSFAPQLQRVHAELLRTIGLDPDDPSLAIDQSAVLSTRLMRHLAALGTLAAIYESAGAAEPDPMPITKRAAFYRQRFNAALLSAHVLIDTDGDGQPDVRRALGLGRLIRA